MKYWEHSWSFTREGHRLCCSREGTISHKLTKFSKSVVSRLSCHLTRSFLINSPRWTPYLWELQIGCRCQNGFQGRQGRPSGRVQSAVCMALQWISSQGRKSSLLLECFPAWLSSPGWDFCCTPDMADAWAFKPNWEMQSEPWLTVHAYFGFHLLRGHRDITITRQQNTHSGAQIWWRNVISSCMRFSSVKQKKKESENSGKNL